MMNVSNLCSPTKGSIPYIEAGLQLQGLIFGGMVLAAQAINLARAGIIIPQGTEGVVESRGKDEAFIRWLDGPAKDFAVKIPLTLLALPGQGYPPINVSSPVLNKDGR